MKRHTSQLQEKYRFGFSFTSLFFYLCQLFPNIIWWAYPPTNDILSANSSTSIVINFVEHASGIIMMATLVLIGRKDKTHNHPAFLFVAILALLAYYVCWVIYYTGNVNPYMFVLGLALMPIIAFGMFGIWRKNYIMLIPLLIFAVFHLTITCGTFL